MKLTAIKLVSDIFIARRSGKLGKSGGRSVYLLSYQEEVLGNKVVGSYQPETIG